MTRSDLSPAMQKAYDALPPEDGAAMLKDWEALHNATIRAAISQVMARNNSHNAGKHVLEVQNRN